MGIREAKFHEGMEVYYVPNSRYRRHETLTVTKVGRKWAQLSNGLRADVSNAVIDAKGFHAPGTLWRSAESYQRQEAIETSWRDFRADVSRIYSAPPGLDVAMINDLRRAIGLEVVEPTNDH